MSRRNFSIRLPDDVIQTLDRLATQVGFGITRNNIIESACEWYVMQCRANGGRPMMDIDQQEIISYIRSKYAAPSFAAAEDPPTYSKPSRKAGAQGSVDGGAPVQVADPRTSETCTKYRHQKKAQS